MPNVKRPLVIDVKAYKKRGGGSGKKAVIYEISDTGKATEVGKVTAPSFQELSRILRKEYGIRSDEKINKKGTTLIS